MKFDEISNSYVKINGVKHIPYPENCLFAKNICKCDYRSHDGVHDAFHDKCEIGFNGFHSTCGEDMFCIYADKPDMCPNFTISCLDCPKIGNCENDMYFVALTLDTSKLDIERKTHPFYK